MRSERSLAQQAERFDVGLQVLRQQHEEQWWLDNWAPDEHELSLFCEHYQWLDGMGVCLRRSVARSEEHTSELQSRFDLVCRLLLEKKKTTDRCGVLSHIYLQLDDKEALIV